MSIDKLKTKFFTGAWLTDVKHYFTKINEIIDYLNGNGTSGNGSYKEYVAILNWDSGTSNVVPVILKNTIGNIIFSVPSSTQLFINSNAAFIENKTTVDIHGTKPSFGQYWDGNVSSTSYIDCYLYDPTGTSIDIDQIENAYLHIKVYN